MKNPVEAIWEIKRLVFLFIIALLISGVTAFFLGSELQFIISNFSFGRYINSWLYIVRNALIEINDSSPFFKLRF